MTVVELRQEPDSPMPVDPVSSAECVATQHRPNSVPCDHDSSSAMRRN